jgi:hypothetical protein
MNIVNKQEDTNMHRMDTYILHSSRTVYGWTAMARGPLSAQ